MTPALMDDWLDHHSKLTDGRVAATLRSITAESAAGGQLGSGAYVKRRLEAIFAEWDRYVDEAFEASEGVRMQGGDLDHFYDGLRTKVTQGGLRVVELVKLLPPFYQPSAVMAAREIAKQEMEKLQAKIRHRQRGFGKTSQASQIVNITGSPGTTVQQGSPGASQTVTFQISNVSAAIEQVEAALPWSAITDSQAEEIRSDLQTIKAQLRKAAPSQGIMKEAAATLRNLTEGVLAGAMTPGAVAAVVALSQSLGLA